ncbi:uncharacterized protein CDAR_285841 [Caerostris darwini]|uniref:Uncharacterized protein n=1 Tax=Caerostris darwini TaxID=1538125 RepID=A0AAV4SXC8_9ARAC|nr:uncharacterized protein CDAR_285841 [Caerostris darwini]
MQNKELLGSSLETLAWESRNFPPRRFPTETRTNIVISIFPIFPLKSLRIPEKSPHYSTYYAIMYPLSLRWTKSRGPIIMIIWGSAVGLSSFQLIHGKAEKFVVSGHEFYDCTEVWEEFDGKVTEFNSINDDLFQLYSINLLISHT